MRPYRLGDWSLWGDEEFTLRFAAVVQGAFGAVHLLRQRSHAARLQPWVTLVQ